MNKYIIYYFSLLILWVSCSGERKSSGDKLQIVTTTEMIRDAVQAITGTHAEVISLMGPGVDPHLYKATQGDLNKLTSADLVFYNGLHLEGKMSDVLEKLGRTKKVVAVSSAIPASHLRQAAGFQGAYDPHIWFDVSLWKQTLDAILPAVQEADTAHAAIFNTNKQRYAQTLDSLHQWVKVHIQQIPASHRVLVTAHDAFGYFGDAYDIEVKGLQGISTLADFGLRDMTQLVDFIINRKIKAIFIETSVSPKAIEAVVAGCKEKGWNIQVGGALYSDAMGAAGTPAGSYTGMVRSNVETIVSALR